MRGTTAAPSRWDDAARRQRQQRRRRRRRGLRSVMAVLLLGALVVVHRDGTAGAAVRNFGVRFQATDTGHILLVGNATVACPPRAAACPMPAGPGDAAAAGAGPGSGFVDVDDDASTFSSSRAALTLPAGAEVLWAGLYWGGSGDGAAAGQVRLARPTLGYETLTATAMDADGARYQGFVDVTAGVRASGAGVYTVADVHAGTGTEPTPGGHAGWALVVAVRDPTAPLRSLTVLDGFAVLGSPASAPATATVRGFTTAPSGPVEARVGVVAYGGTPGVGGDGVSLDGLALADGANPAGDVFNGTSSRGGSPTPDDGPVAGPGVDVDDLVADAGLANGATQATVAVQASDAVAVGVLTAAIGTVQPQLQVGKSAEGPTGRAPAVGDIVGYTIEVANRGNQEARSVVLTDPLPAGVSLVPGSLRVDNGPAPGVGTGAAHGDPMVHDLSGNLVVVGLGADAAPPGGGTLAAGAAVTVRFQVRVDEAAAGDRLTNQAQVAYRSPSGNVSLAALSDDPARVGVGDATSTPASTAPTAGADDAVSEGRAVAIDVLANDVDADGEVLSVVAVEPPDAGVATCPPAGPCTYQPPAAFAGTATFTYTVVDGAGLRSAATVTVVVTPPPASPAPAPATAGSTPAPPPAAPPAGVPAGAAPTGPAEPATAAARSLTRDDPSRRDGAEVAVAALGAVGGADAGAGATDGSISVAGAAASVAAAQAQAPRAVDDEAVTEAGRPVVIPVLDNDVDADGDLVRSSVTVVRTPTRGSAEPVDGTIRYSPGSGLAGTDQLSYRVCDAAGRCAEAMVRVTVTPVVLPAVPAQGGVTTTTAPASSTTPSGSAASPPPSGPAAAGPLAGTGADPRAPVALALLLVGVGTGLVSEAHRLAPLAHAHRRRRPRHRRPRHRRPRHRSTRGR